jgi:hypothetical protein
LLDVYCAGAGTCVGEGTDVAVGAVAGAACVAAGGVTGAVASILDGVAFQNALTRIKPAIAAKTRDPNRTRRFMVLRLPCRASVVSITVGFVAYNLFKMALLFIAGTTRQREKSSCVIVA